MYRKVSTVQQNQQSGLERVTQISPITAGLQNRPPEFCTTPARKKKLRQTKTENKSKKSQVLLTLLSGKIQTAQRYVYGVEGAEEEIG